MTVDVLAWVHWWHLGWRQADASWWPASLSGLCDAHLDALARGHHEQCAAAFALAPTPPPTPLPVMAPLLAGPAPQRALCLEIVAALCQPTRVNTLSPNLRDWCLSVARALRPGQWLGDGSDALALLRAWLPPSTWQRARLGFPRARIERLESEPLCQPPAGRLQALWHAAHWQAQQIVAVPPGILTYADPTHP